MSRAEADRAVPSFEARAGVRADGPLTVDLSEPPAAGFCGCLDVAGGDLLLERFVAIRIPEVNWKKSDSTCVLPPICLVRFNLRSDLCAQQFAHPSAGVD